MTERARAAIGSEAIEAVADRGYYAADDVYICPAGEQLTYHYTNEEDGKTLRRYWTPPVRPVH
jgi:HJR/Mrr/RecB family endonuclease